MIDKPLSRRSFLPASLALGGIGLQLAGHAHAADAPAAVPAGLTTAPVSQSDLSPRLTMHAIDIFHGTPGAGMKVDLSMFDNGAYKPLKSIETAPNGRSADPLLLEGTYKAGRYEVLLHIDEYFSRFDTPLPKPTFLSTVPLRFVVRNPQERIHLAILFTPWSYSYYRGS
ncbi:hydroxyisourate hydrolase [Variovorax rhizosphaerae]|uniref:Hydroxyisourate hydrolase n=1 Tax=Variovorax rhizosphaerae TaxID=1836200 RepID=A0ABU8WP05_9BURK